MLLQNTIRGNERVNGLKTLLKSERHHYYPFFSLIRGKLTWKESPWVWYEILRLFVNTLTAGDKYSCRNMQFTTTISNAIILKRKHFFSIFIAFLKNAWNLEHFQKKDKYSSLIISEIIDSERLLKHVNVLASEHNSVMNVVTGSKLCWNEHGTTIIIFSREFEVNWVRKNLV